MSTDNPAKALSDLLAVVTTMESIERSFAEDDEDTLSNLNDRMPYVISHWRTTIEDVIRTLETVLAPAAGIIEDTEKQSVN